MFLIVAAGVITPAFHGEPPVMPGVEIEADLGEDPGPGLDEPCVDCGEDPGPGVPVEVDPASDADGYIGTIWEDGGRKVVVYTPDSAERATRLAQGVYYEVGYLTLLPGEWTDRA